MCEHKELEHNYTIEATTSTIIESSDEGDILSSNNEYGNLIREEVSCLECGKRWTVGNKIPKFVADFVERIDKLK